MGNCTQILDHPIMGTVSSGLGFAQEMDKNVIIRPNCNTWQLCSNNSLVMRNNGMINSSIPQQNLLVFDRQNDAKFDDCNYYITNSHPKKKFCE